MTVLFWIIVAFRIVWLSAILSGTAYVVFWLGYSGWWWLLALILMASGSQAEMSETTKAAK